MTIAENIRVVTEKIRLACESSSRGPDSVKVVAVSKTVGIGKIAEAVAAGLTVFGENRVQEAWQKYQASELDVEWHMIGHLQSNKVRRTLQFADMIQSVDSVKLAREIDLEAGRLDRQVPVLIQVNCSGEESKFGFAPQDTPQALEEIVTLPRLSVRGLMTIGAHSADELKVRRSFESLRKLRDKLMAHQFPDVDLSELSMGMSGDFAIAIEEGSTLVRIGRSIFGERLN